MKVKYTESDREKLFEDLLLRHYSKGEPAELTAFRSFFETGDVDSFIKNGGQVVNQYSTFFVGGNPTLSSLIYRLEAFWSDLLSNPEKYSSTHLPKDATKEELFSRWVNSCFSTFHELFIPRKLYPEMFKWMFGGTFEREKMFPLAFGTEKWRPVISLDPDWIMATLLRGFMDCLFDMNSDLLVDPRRVLPLRDYFMSTVPFSSKEIYSTTLFDERHRKQDGEYSGYLFRQMVLRRFIARVNGILSEDEIEEGLSDVIIAKPQELKIFRQEFEAAVPYPDLYGNLVNFIQESGDEYVWASE